MIAGFKKKHRVISRLSKRKTAEDPSFRWLARLTGSSVSFRKSPKLLPAEVLTAF